MKYNSCSLSTSNNLLRGNKQVQGRLLRLDHWGSDDLGAKDAIPEAARHPKAILVVEEVVLEVILLQRLVPERKVLVVKEVVRHVVQSVAEHATGERRSAHVPVEEENLVGKRPERSREDDKQCWGHDKPISVHREVVVNAVKEEVQRETDTIIG